MILQFYCRYYYTVIECWQYCRQYYNLITDSIVRWYYNFIADIIDPAILRPGRLDKILFVDLPSSDDRIKILQTITKVRWFINTSMYNDNNNDQLFIQPIWIIWNWWGTWISISRLEPNPHWQRAFGWKPLLVMNAVTGLGESMKNFSSIWYSFLLWYGL